MAYTAVKLTDVQKAIAAVTAAQKKYTDAQSSTKTTKTALDNAQKALDIEVNKLQKLQSDFDSQKYLTTNSGYKSAQAAFTAAEKKLNDARDLLDSGRFLENNQSYKNAVNAITVAERNRNAAQSRLDAATDKTRPSLEKALQDANKTVDTAYANVDKVRANLEKTAQTNISNYQKLYDNSQAALDKARQAAEKAAYTPIIAQQKLIDQKQGLVNTANDKYVSLQDSFQPLLDRKNEAINNVSNYINDIRGSLGDITKFADAKQVQTLLGQIQTAVKNTKLDDLINPVTSMISEIDPLKMASIPTVNLPKANPDYFTNIDPNTGLPVLDQGGLDKVIDKYGTNSLTANQYRDNWDKFGWNVKSDGSSVARGAAIFGLEKTVTPMGGGVSYTGDFNKAAQQAGVDISGLKTNEEKYNAINDATKDFYVVANALDRTSAGANEKAPHAAILFKADGSGNLVPVSKPDGSLAANYYDAVGVSHAGWRGQLAELAPVISIASMAFLPGLGQALGSQIASTAAGQAIGTAASNAIANAAIGAGMAAITGGDIGKAALTSGIGSFAAQNASEIANKVVGADNIKAIADAANLTRGQVENIITNGISEALASGITDKGNILENVARTVAGSFASEEARNLTTRALLDADQSVLSRAADAAANLANVGTQAAIAGKNPLDVISAAAPSIIASTSGVPVEERAGIEDRSVDAYKQIIAALDPNQVAAGNANPEDLWEVIVKINPNENINALFSTGTPDPNAKYTSVIGTGASGGTSDDFALVAKDAVGEEATITWLESEIPKASPERQAEIQQTINKIKNKQELVPSQNFEKVKSEAAFNAERVAGQQIYGADYIPPDQLGKYIEYLRAQLPAASGQTAPVGPGEISTSASASQTKPSLYPSSGFGTSGAGFSYSQFQGIAQSLYKSAGINPTSSQVDALASQLMADSSSKAGAGTGTGAEGTGGAGGTGTGGAGTGGTGTGVEGTGTGEEGTEELAKKQAALQQYQQYMNKLKAQQQGALQDINKQSVFYLTPEEQEAREYFNPATVFESVTPFKRGGLASMKRNTKWQ